MLDQSYTPGWRRTLRVARGVAYAFVALFGLSGLIFTPNTIVGTIGEPLTYWWASLAVLGGLGALTGIITGKYRIEWPFVWLAFGGTAMYGFTVWVIVLDDSITRSAQANGATALAVLLLVRTIELAGKAAKLRAEHRADHVEAGRWTGHR